uniref:Uncharacterized protein n=1 Tax=Lymantria dispar multicapsid nuclear polyhedrosis virus TaxID=10449 RepID=A0A7S8F9L8_NPVLD|nr:hypothetical protein [Lymantria dispar multiple nucleopolyhedrovirus]QPD01975.1 hypothetical protein [Lymantria dispar multiple nucleopolyhedrovirus]
MAMMSSRGLIPLLFVSQKNNFICILFAEKQVYLLRSKNNFICILFVSQKNKFIARFIAS